MKLASAQLTPSSSSSSRSWFMLTYLAIEHDSGGLTAGGVLGGVGFVALVALLALTCRPSRRLLLRSWLDTNKVCAWGLQVSVLLVRLAEPCCGASRVLWARDLDWSMYH